MPLSPPPPYAPSELAAALSSLAGDDAKPEDVAHLRDTGEDGSNLSALQSITACRILDYEKMPKPNLDELRRLASADADRRLNLLATIRSRSPAMCLAAEFKRASPSKGPMGIDLDPAAQGASYFAAGADVISVLTEERWFRGGLDDLRKIREATSAAAERAGRRRPAMLRKDFVVSEHQVYEAAAAGADTVLLIVAVTPRPLLTRLVAACRDVGMEPLVEIHAAEELDVALDAGARVIGVNNRNLHTFELDLGTTDRAAEQLRKRNLKFDHMGSGDVEYALCALSGMSDAADVDRYRKVGVGMVLIGESLMRSPDPGDTIRKLCLDPDDYQKKLDQQTFQPGLKLIKVCGITAPDDALAACRAGANLIGVIFAPKSKRRVDPSQASAVVRAVRAFGERAGPTAALSALASSPPASASPIRRVAHKSLLLERVASRTPLVVGVFQDAPPDEIRRTAAEVGLDLVQLHGDEGMAACADCGVPALRVVHVRADEEGGDGTEGRARKIAASLTGDPVAVLLDTAVRGAKGGTGVTFDWKLAEVLQEEHGLPVIVAGGLTADNVTEAVEAVKPWGVDVSSGVEVSPGVKDLDKVRAFVKGARGQAAAATN